MTWLMKTITRVHLHLGHCLLAWSHNRLRAPGLFGGYTEFIECMDEKATDVQINSCTNDLLSNMLVKLRDCFPCEFSRKPRTLTQIGQWKATEF